MLQGQNVISLIEYSLCHEKNQDILSPHSPENSPKGWLDLQHRPISQRKLIFSPLSTTREHRRIILCLSASFLYPPFDFLFCVKHMLAHFFKFLHEQVTLLQLPFLFLSSLCTPVSTHMSRHTHVRVCSALT